MLKHRRPGVPAVINPGMHREIREALDLGEAFETFAYAYPGPTRDGSLCELRAIAHDGSNVVIVSERHDNPGRSITNAIEEIHGQFLAGVFGDRPEPFVLLEHYGPSSYEKPGEDRFDLVTMRDGQVTWAPFAHQRNPNARGLLTAAIGETAFAAWFPHLVDRWLSAA